MAAFATVPALAERIVLDASAGGAAMPRIFSTSTWPFDPFPGKTVEDWFFANFRPGLIQIDLGEQIFSKSASPVDALVRAGAAARFLHRVQERGGRVMISISKIPPWASSNPSRAAVAAGEGTQIASASPPADPVAWATFIERIAAEFAGLDSPSFRIGWEPDTKIWQGTDTQFFDYYVTTALAIRRAIPTARVGGPGVSDLGAHWREASGTSMLERFLAHVADAGAPLDFVAVHGFTTSPWVSWRMFREQVSAFAARAGLSPDIPIFVGEWADRPDPFSEVRETPQIAAYVLANLIGMAEAGIQDHSYTSLTEQQVNEGNEFSGGFGLFTQSMILRPAALAFLMIDRMGDRRLPVVVQDGEVFALAGRRGDTVTLLIANYVPDERVAIKDYIDGMRRQGVTNAQLARIAGSESGLRSLAEDASAPSEEGLRDAHDTASAATALRRAAWDTGRNLREITIDVTGLPGGPAAEVTVFRIDSSHGVPASNARALGRALAEARRGLTEPVLIDALRRAGHTDGDFGLVRRLSDAWDKEAFVRSLSADEVRRLVETATAIMAAEQSLGLPVARSALESPATGFTATQRVTIAGQRSLSFDIRMEPNSVVLLEFSGG